VTVALGGLVAPVLLAGCGGAPPGGEPVREPPAPAPVTRSAPAAEPAAIARFAREHFPGVYAGVAVEGGTTAVYRLPSEQFDTALRREFDGQSIVFRDARHSEAQLQQLTRQILDQTGYWRSRGVDIQGAGPDFVQGVVEVLTPDAETARRLLPERYGDRVAVREGSVAPAEP
jgi:hypothetical protein